MHGHGLALRRKRSGGVSKRLLRSSTRSLWSAALRAANLWASFPLCVLRRNPERVHRHLRRGYRHPRRDHGRYSGSAENAGQELCSTHVPSSVVCSPDVSASDVRARSLSSAYN